MKIYAFHSHLPKARAPMRFASAASLKSNVRRFAAGAEDLGIIGGKLMRVNGAFGDLVTASYRPEKGYDLRISQNLFNRILPALAAAEITSLHTLDVPISTVLTSPDQFGEFVSKSSPKELILSSFDADPAQPSEKLEFPENPSINQLVFSRGSTEIPIIGDLDLNGLKGLTSVRGLGRNVNVKKALCMGETEIDLTKNTEQAIDLIVDIFVNLARNPELVVRGRSLNQVGELRKILADEGQSRWIAKIVRDAGHSSDAINFYTLGDRIEGVKS